MDGDQQGELDFDKSGQPDGVQEWRARRAQAVRDLALRLGLPLNRQAEVRLYDGVTLRGLLCLREEILFLDAISEGDLELRVGRATFNYHEIESCVRLD